MHHALVDGAEQRFAVRAAASMRTRSPKRMKPVRGAPWARVSMARRSAMQAEPTARSALDTVPEPIRVPALNLRVRAAWAIN